MGVRPSASAARNFLTGYCMAPTAVADGTMGMGGGRKSGDDDR